MQNDTYCNNCGKPGHMYHQCKLPITSIGIIAFRLVDKVPQYLMIRRKDSLGHIDFMRGKYSVLNKHYIINMLNQMTVDEKARMNLKNFDNLWRAVWGGNTISSQYKNEEIAAREKYNMLIAGITSKFNKTYTLSSLIDESNLEQENMGFPLWTETEWGFPKGRRNHQEKDYDCALREFNEETGYPVNLLKNVQNILPYEEIFTGSNYKSYKHKYYLMYMNYADTLDTGNFETAEVSKMEWKTFDECLESIRNYNVEKKRLIERVHQTLTRYNLCFL
jgi:8-oxo-dGTP pyrophosphatase MutT (NUDIX family)